MRDEGHNVCVIASGRNDEKHFEFIDKIKIYRIPINKIKLNFFGIIRFVHIAIKIMRKIFESENINIVHVYHSPFMFLIKIFTFYNKREIKWIYEIRSGWLSEINIIRRLINLSTFFVSLNFDLIFIHDGIRNDIFKNYMKNKVFSTLIGFDSKEFNYNNKDKSFLLKYNIIRDNKITLGYLGSLGYERKLKHLILAFKMASNIVNNIQLVFIGIGDDMENLKVFTNRISLSNKVFFIGYLDYSNIPLILSEIDIAISYIPIIPMFDGQPPTKTIEYLASSLPVIATNTVGNKQLIKHEQNGLLVRDDPYSVSKVIIRLCEDIKLREKLVKNSRISIIKYDWKNLFEQKLLPIYRELINN